MSWTGRPSLPHPTCPHQSGAALGGGMSPRGWAPSPPNQRVGKNYPAPPPNSAPPFHPLPLSSLPKPLLESCSVLPRAKAKLCSFMSPLCDLGQVTWLLCALDYPCEKLWTTKAPDVGEGVGTWPGFPLPSALPGCRQGKFLPKHSGEKGTALRLRFSPG